MGREAAPQARANRDSGGAIAHGVGAVERVGLVAEAKFLLATITAMAAGQIFLQRDPIALFQAKAPPCVAPKTLDAAHGFVAQNQRALGLRIFQIIGPVAAADAGHLDAQQARIRSDVGQRQLAHLGLANIETDGGGNGLHDTPMLKENAEAQSLRWRYAPCLRARPRLRISPYEKARPAAARRRPSAPHGNGATAQAASRPFPAPARRASTDGGP